MLRRREKKNHLTLYILHPADIICPGGCFESLYSIGNTGSINTDYTWYLWGNLNAMTYRKIFNTQISHGEKNVIEAFDGFIIYTEKVILYFDSFECQNKAVRYHNPNPINYVIYLKSLEVIVMNMRDGSFKILQLSNDKKFIESQFKLKYSDTAPKKAYLNHIFIANRCDVFSYELGKTIVYQQVNLPQVHNNRTLFKSLVEGFTLYNVKTNVRNFTVEKLELKYTYFKNSWNLVLLSNYTFYYDPSVRKHYNPDDEDECYYDVGHLSGSFLAYSDDYVITRVHKEIHILCAGIKTKVTFLPMITTCMIIEKNVLLIATDQYTLFYLNLIDFKLKEVSGSKLSIIPEVACKIRSHIFLCSNNLSGFYVFNIKDPSKVGFVRGDMYTFNDEVNLFEGISHVFEDALLKPIICYTDGKNSVISRDSYDFTILSQKFKFSANQTFIGYINTHYFLTKDFNSNFYINGIKPCSNSSDFVDLKMISPQYAVFSYGVKKIKFAEGILSFIDFFSVSVTCCYVFNNVVAVYNKIDQSVTIFEDSEISKHKVSINFIPTNLIVYNLNKLIVLYDAYNLTVLRRKEGNSTEYDIQTVDLSGTILNVDHTTDLFFIQSCENVFAVDLLCTNPILISKKRIFTHVFRSTYNMIGVSAVNKGIYLIHHSNPGKHKLIKRFRGKLLQCLELREGKIIISTALEMFEIDIAPKECGVFETPILGIIRDSLDYGRHHRLVYTDDVLYMVDKTDISIKASLSVPNIKDVAFDENVDHFIVLTKTKVRGSYNVLEVDFTERFEIVNNQNIFVDSDDVIIEPVSHYLISDSWPVSYKRNHISLLAPPRVEFHSDFPNQIKYCEHYGLFVYCSVGLKLEFGGCIIRTIEQAVHFHLCNSDILLFVTSDGKLYYLSLRTPQMDPIKFLDLGPGVSICNSRAIIWSSAITFSEIDKKIKVAYGNTLMYIISAKYICEQVKLDRCG